MINLEDKEEYGLIHLSVAVIKLCTLARQIDADKATIHHADFSRHRVLGKAGIEDDDEVIVDYLNQWHVNENGWKAIGYHAVIVPDGRLVLLYRTFKGLNGAHVKGNNVGNIGILVWGDFNEERPTKAQEEMIRALRANLETYCGIEIFRLHKDFANNPHKGDNITDCPGKNFPVELWKP